MKKILAVFDGYKLCKSTLQHGISIAKENGNHLTGVFLDSFFYRNYNLTKVLKTSLNPDETIKKLDREDELQRSNSVYEFETACQQANISFSIHRDHSVPLIELQYESMFADLIVINEREKFTRSDTRKPTEFIRDLLTDVQCPVLVVPDNFSEIKKLVFLYDGEPASLYAIKMFSYIFDVWRDLPVEVITVNERNVTDFQLPGSILMTDFVNRRFTHSSFTLLRGNTEEMVLSHLLTSGGGQMVVLGAYQRSDFSRWLKRSIADTLMIGLDMPLFIAHH